MIGNKKVGLALGGGSARGIAHVGVLEVLERSGIVPDMIAGTSMGAIVGAIYATGGDMTLLAKLAASLNERDLLDVTVRRTMGMLKGERAQQLIRLLTKDMDFDQAHIPLAVVACDLETGEKIVFRSGRIHEAVRASISIPMVFEPYTYCGRVLVDGGVVDRCPTSVVREMGADLVIGVDVGFRGQKRRELGKRRDVIMQSLDIMGWEITRRQEHSSNFMILPDVLQLSSYSLQDAEVCAEQGREATSKALPGLMKYLETGVVEEAEGAELAL